MTIISVTWCATHGRPVESCVLEPSVFEKLRQGHMLPDPWPPKDAPFEVAVVDRVMQIVPRTEPMAAVPPKPTPSCEPVVLDNRAPGLEAALAEFCRAELVDYEDRTCVFCGADAGLPQPMAQPHAEYCVWLLAQRLLPECTAADALSCPVHGQCSCPAWCPLHSESTHPRDLATGTRAALSVQLTAGELVTSDLGVALTAAAAGIPVYDEDRRRKSLADQRGADPRSTS